MSRNFILFLKTDNIFTDDPKKIKLSDATENYTNLSSSSRIKTPTTPVLEGMEGVRYMGRQRDRGKGRGKDKKRGWGR